MVDSKGLKRVKIQFQHSYQQFAIIVDDVMVCLRSYYKITILFLSEKRNSWFC